MANLTDNSKIYSLCEAVADIALEVATAKFISIDSRLVVNMVIMWANEFETINI